MSLALSRCWPLLVATACIGDPVGTAPPGTSDATAPPGSNPSAPAATESPPLRRLTGTQYRNAVRDVLGEPLPELVLDGEPAVHGFTSVGASSIVTSHLGVERYEATARALASFVMTDAPRRAALVGCVPQQPGDTTCASAFLARLGRQLYRRTLTQHEIERVATLATNAAVAGSDFWVGAEAGLAALLSSPKFLYRAELGQPGVDGLRRYTSVELGSRLAFFFWNAPPDQELLDAAASGALDDVEGRLAQAGRLLASPKARSGFRHFFQELIQLEDPSSTPPSADLSVSLSGALHEQALRTFEEALFVRHETIGQLVSSPVTFLNDELAAHYGLPLPGSGTMIQVSLAPDQARPGVLGLGALLIKLANPPHTSPTIRGKFVREALLCQTIPPPPPGVATELPSVPEGVSITTRERLDLHRADPKCAGCHELMDPIGLGLENFDALGRYRAQEHNLPIDASGTLDGVAFNDATGLVTAISQHPELARCFALQLARFLTGQAAPHPAVEALAHGYATNAGSFETLLLEYVRSELFVEARAGR